MVGPCFSFHPCSWGRCSSWVPGWGRQCLVPLTQRRRLHLRSWGRKITIQKLYYCHAFDHKSFALCRLEYADLLMLISCYRGERPCTSVAVIQPSPGKCAPSLPLEMFCKWPMAMVICASSWSWLYHTAECRVGVTIITMMFDCVILARLFVMRGTRGKA